MASDPRGFCHMILIDRDGQPVHNWLKEDGPRYNPVEFEGKKYVLVQGSWNRCIHQEEEPKK